MDTLGTWDYVVFGIFLLVSIAIGIFYRFSGGRQQTVQEYMLADRKMSAIPVSMSLMTSFISAVTILGTTSENYLYGTQYLLLNFSYVIGTPIVNFVFLPVFFNSGDKISVYQYLDSRFGPYARLAAALAFSLQMTLYMGVVLYAPSLAISAVTGMDKVVAILSIGTACTIYSTIGGIKAVLITDLIQGTLMFLAIFAVIIKGLVDIGSVGHILSVVEESGHIEFFNFDLDPTTRHTVWGTLIGGLFTFLSLHAVNQAQIQRMRTLENISSARWSLFASSIFVVILSFSLGFMGLLMYVNYQKCDPLISKRICKSDQLVPFFVLESFKNFPGLTGFFIAGLMSGSLSTISTAINSLSAVCWEDFVKPALDIKGVHVKSSTIPFVTKMIAFTFGLSSIGVAFIAEQFTSVLTASMTIFGIIGGPILGMFTLGMMMPFVSQRAAVSSFLVALGFGLWIGFGGPRPSPVRIPPSPDQCPIWSNSSCPMTSGGPPRDDYFYLYKVSYLWYSLITFTITIILGAIISLWYPQETKVSEALLSPALRRIINASEARAVVKEENTKSNGKGEVEMTYVVQSENADSSNDNASGDSL
ncbi:putative sodium-dependent multivitamin transporter [Folsomia candida]|uniref:Putative sodium-dependent multivitamin transporter n=1 Tax=Folsomia candida TaxID=158441 RepID=A0A226ERX5_FOLCA|nr:putative sodium-dependent multivitamin transporter [Folsomia candida]XP_035704138.1 putative sodium-dependent multivitamin transporter [Folsomia candida]OXA60259.1 putative sodium-dependent multivitamin transporter [Folsomia candida]